MALFIGSYVKNGQRVSPIFSGHGLRWLLGLGWGTLNMA